MMMQTKMKNEEKKLLNVHSSVTFNDIFTPLMYVKEQRKNTFLIKFTYQKDF